MSSKNVRSGSGHSPLGESNGRMQIEILRIRDCHRTGITCRLRTCLYRSSPITLEITTRFAFLWMISRVKNPLARPDSSITHHTIRILSVISSVSSFFILIAFKDHFNYPYMSHWNCARDPSSVTQLIYGRKFLRIYWTSSQF